MIAILRKCVRCKQYESVDNFAPLSKLCKPCMRAGTGRLGVRGQSRCIVLTESGRELLRQWREDEAASPAA